MCRLFGMTAGPIRASACFWLVEAPDSLAAQSRREPDGTGLGWYDEHDLPRVEKQPIAAYSDLAFAREARERRSRTFIAHIRLASTGALETRNTHPFEQAGRLLAHNGVIGDLDRLDRHLGEQRALVEGETDSERFFALITKETAAAGGDVGAGIARAARWVADELPVYALNVVLVTADELWALRYPDTHDLFVLERQAGGPGGSRHLEHASAAGHIRVRSADLATTPAVVVASERMDEDPGWRAITPGHVVHVGPDLEVRSTMVLEAPPRHRLALADLDPRAAASQRPSGPPAAVGHRT
ncbi:MAG: class glutamine amidotransferase [Solirubrobacterales bacterium]|jgi:predicted glutamine amidotransferase|nr:class glutamine amidotransferase [Solirubrobacterales bacterium]